VGSTPASAPTECAGSTPMCAGRSGSRPPWGAQLGTDLNRDILRESLADRGVQPVRQIAIDQVWSALRFRPA
jgi:hypothetical protein